MKLLTKTNNLFLIFLLLLFPVMVAIDYYLIQYFVHSEVNEILLNESERIAYQLETQKELPQSSYIFETTPIGEGNQPAGRYVDTLIFDEYTEELVPFRKYEFVLSTGEEAIKISLRHVLLEVNKLIFWLFVTTAFVLILIVVGSFVINKRISKRAWKPFFNNLSKLKNYNITRREKVLLESSGISEFDALNQVITTLMEQIEKDFQNLKEFNENISHEMQTPLAVIRNKMVLLLENQNLSTKELRWVRAAYQEVNKLSKIGKSLTLISKIENQEFSRLENVDIRTMIDNIMGNMEEIIRFKSLEMTVVLDPVQLNCDPILANILFTNLIKNAIQHNWEGGSIRMQLSNEGFEIENTGEMLNETETTHLFNRFQKGTTATANLGLGLAINQRICELYGFQLDYEQHEGKHKFSVLFRN